MKAKLHKLTGTAVLGLALVSQSLPTWAGVATRNEVYISASGSYAQGSLTGARYSADSGQSIGCDYYYDLEFPGYPPAAYCYATDRRGKHTYCFSRDPRIVDAVKGMTDSSHLYFSVPNLVTRGCTDLTVDNASIYLR
jgi:hypothetical protein